ncbi:MAG TPA: hypothetical protein VLZ53_00350 [Devosia sp.]|nr:hypothetical protein [Devosia sp.]
MSRFLAILLIGLTSPALAGGTAIISGAGSAPDDPNEQYAMEVTWLDDQTVRMDPEGTPAYMLVRDGSAYSITDAGGQLMVLDMGSIMKLAGSMGGGMPAGAAQQAPTVADAESVDSLEPTGRKETVAGISGEVYEVRWTSSDGEVHVDEAVLSDDPLLLEMSSAFQAFGAALAGEQDAQPLNDAMEAEGLAALRFGDRYRVTAISDDTPPDSHFQLPAKPMDLGQGFGQFQ